MENDDELFGTYNDNLYKQLDRHNVVKIVEFLNKQGCDFIEDILTTYLDLFLFQYDDFVAKYNSLNHKYHYNFLNEASENMNLLEEFYNI